MSSPSIHREALGTSRGNTASNLLHSRRDPVKNKLLVTSQRPYKATLNSGSFCFEDLFVSIKSLSNDVSFFSFSLQRLNAMALGSPVSPKEGDSTSNSEPEACPPKVGGIHSAAYLFCICFTVLEFLISVGCGFRDRQLLSRMSVTLNRSFLYQPMCRTCPLGSLSPLPVPSPSWHCDGHVEIPLAVCYRRWR